MDPERHHHVSETGGATGPVSRCRGHVDSGAALAVALGVTSSGSRLAARGAQQPAAVNGIAPEGLAEIEALLQEKETRSPAERKIDSQLLYARRMQQGLPVAPASRRSRSTSRTPPTAT